MDKEIRFLLKVDKQDYEKLKKQPRYDYRYDYYFNEYRMRRLKERDKPWRYEKINSSQSGLAVKKKEKLNKEQFEKILKASGKPLFVLKVESLYPVNQDGKELYIERVTTPEKKIYFTTEYDPSQDGDFKTFVHNLKRCTIIKKIKNLGPINMKQLYFKISKRK